MEARKNPNIDLRGKQSLFFHIGLVISLFLVIVAFEWKSVNEPGTIVLDDPIEEGIVFVDVPNTVIEDKQPPKPIVKQKLVRIENIIETKDEIAESEKMEITVDPLLDDEIENGILAYQPDVEKADEVVSFAQEQASFPGGEKAWNKFLKKNLKYTRQAQMQQIEGRVYVQFIVEKDGSLSDIKIAKGLGAGLDEEVLRVLKLSPKWSPAKQSFRPVRFRMMLPIYFKYQ
ncbi:TonB family protein [Cytophagales bacterium LB-30]|uniref:TonB family protein n=1 Tax=Shiella aurantiaca TaxID=3058365 RepID=A0ABT8F2L7_9BACT|nr:TonB family protein [Shiella aurantiaca]MDN4164698.1 TonB family protein [Shiella aurantiaca]